MKVLMVHRAGAGQFGHLAAHLAARGDEVTLLCETADAAPPGVRVIAHGTEPSTRWPGGAGAAVDYHLRLGERAGKVMDALASREGAPDIILGHAGWGSPLFAKDALPATPMIAHCEFFYRYCRAHVGFRADKTVGLLALHPLRYAQLAHLAPQTAAHACRVTRGSAEIL